jgi:rare lipoprotein A
MAAPSRSVTRSRTTEIGIASWYGHPYHGRRAADGEIYDMEKLTAAHRTLRFNTRVRVVNLSNARAVIVRITDRGPFVDSRIIDLSKAAARAIDLLHTGIAPVRVEVTDAPAASLDDHFGVQVGAFQEQANAERCLEEMRSRYGVARLAFRDGEPALWRVQVGSLPTQEWARALASRIREESGQNAFLVRIDP